MDYTATEPAGILKFRCLTPMVTVWDAHGHRYFTLSYNRILFPPDVFPLRNVISLEMRGQSPRRKKNEGLYRR